MLLDRDQPLFLRLSYVPRMIPFLWRYMSHANDTHVRHYARHMSYLLGDSYAQHMSLAQGTGAEKFVHDNDYCFGYATRAAYEADSYGWGVRRDYGVPYTVMSGADYAAIDPVFSDQFETVILCPNHGRISDPGAYVQALCTHFEEQGGTVKLTTLKDIEMGPDGCEALITSDGRMTADHIVLALGPWSADSARKMGASKLSFESERGYHVEFVAPSVMPKNPMMVAAGKFVMTPMDGRIRCAGVVEFGGLKAGPSRAPFDLLYRAVSKLLPDLTYADTREWMGHRPAPADSLPLIGPMDKAGKGYVGFGHQHVGLTGGPKTGRLIADMISGRAPNADMSAFDPARYG